ncbi:MAG: beta-glucosidase, partial [Alloprevotella sp.]|nr:beta-glucosidase [Alloprevotella sp.]
MKRSALLLLLLYTCACAMVAQPYKDASLPADERVEDLLGRMTTAEKVAQLLCPMGWTYDERKDSVGVGMLWATFRADPWTGRTLENGFTPQTAARRANELQRHAVEETRLGIPLLLAEEAPHGHMAIGTTTFPTGLGLGATFSTELMERVGKTIARELHRQGGHIAFGPVLDLARDPRWSRTEECMGEDTHLVGELGAALVKGIVQEGAIATLKHLAAYGMGMGGQNGAAVSLGRRELLRDYLPPFRRAIEAGAGGVMTAYGAIDGVPCTSNPWLLREVLREQWGFRGLVVSDLYSINVLHNTLHVASSLEEAARMALQAGVDVDLGAKAFGQFKVQSA